MTDIQFLDSQYVSKKMDYDYVDNNNSASAAEDTHNNSVYDYQYQEEECDELYTIGSSNRRDLNEVQQDDSNNNIDAQEYNLEDDCIELEREQNEELIYENSQHVYQYSAEDYDELYGSTNNSAMVDSIGSYGNDEQYEIDELVEDFSGSENDVEQQHLPDDTDSEGLFHFLIDLVDTNKYDNIFEVILGHDNRLKLRRNRSLNGTITADREERRTVALDNVKIQLQEFLRLQRTTVDVGALSTRSLMTDDLYACMYLSRSPRKNTAIQSLRLSCNLGDDIEVLRIILQSNIKDLNLSNNNIGSPGAAKIAEHLETNTGMIELNLDRNSFKDTDAILFAKSLKKNTKLQQLQIRQNNFTLTGVKYLIKGVFDTSSLNAMSDCNHVCALQILSEPAVVRRERLNMSGINWELDRTSKVLSLFCVKESMMHYLEDLPVEYMPDVLSFIQNEKDQKKLTNTMYAIVRYWEMPTLYSFHSGALPQSRRCNGSAGKRKRDYIE